MNRINWPRRTPTELRSLGRAPVDPATLKQTAALVGEVEEGGETA